MFDNKHSCQKCVEKDKKIESLLRSVDMAIDEHKATKILKYRIEELKGKTEKLLEVMKLIALGIEHRKPSGMSTPPVSVRKEVLRRMAAEAVAEYEKEEEI